MGYVWDGSLKKQYKIPAESFTKRLNKIMKAEKQTITQGQMLTLIYDENELTMMLFNKMMKPEIDKWRQNNTILSASVQASHRTLIEKYFVIENGRIKETLGDHTTTPPTLPSKVYKEGMTEEMFNAEEKQWSEEKKTMLI